jgi:hypothetical protein
MSATRCNADIGLYAVNDSYGLVVVHDEGQLSGIEFSTSTVASWPIVPVQHSEYSVAAVHSITALLLSASRNP